MKKSCLAIVFILIFVLTSAVQVPDKKLIHASEIIQKIFKDNAVAEGKDYNKAYISSRYLKNLSGAKSFILVEHESDGYAIIDSNDYTLVEYSNIGSSPYHAVKGKDMFYLGPTRYFVDEGDGLKDLHTDRIFKQDELGKMKQYEEILFNQIKNCTVDKRSTIFEESDMVVSGWLDADLYTIKNRVFVPAYNFFVDNDFYPVNNDNFCSTISAQLLLSYHNWYSDGRLIPNGDLGDGLRFLPAGRENYISQPYSDIMRRTTYDDLNNPTNKSDTFHDVLKDRINTSVGEGATNEMIYNGINHYLNDYVNEYKSNYIMSYDVNNTANQDDAINVIKSEINSGRPVITSIMYIEANGLSRHSVISYGMQTIKDANNVENEGFIVNMGWGKSLSYVWIKASLVTGYLTFRTTHNHSDSFLTQGGESGYDHIYQCESCSRTVTTNNHVRYGFAPYGSTNEDQSTYHYEVCICGLKLRKEHSYYKYVILVDNGVNNTEKHRKECICGRSVLENHVVKVDACSLCGVSLI